MRHFLRASLFAFLAGLLLTAPLASAPIHQAAPDAANAPLTTAFSYQGRLEKGGALVTAACSMTFSLFDAVTNGTQIGSDQSINPVEVSTGLFAVTLNGGGEFGATAFDGNARFLQIAVLCPGDASAVTLPRQQLTAAPYAVTSLSTEALQGRPVANTAPTTGQALAWDGTKWTPQTFSNAGPNDWSSLSGIPEGFADNTDNEGPVPDWNTLPNIPAGFADDVDNNSGGDVTAVTAGSGLSGGGASGDLSLALDTGVTDNLYWQLDGNAGVAASGFLGTTDSMTLTFKVNNTTALRLGSGNTPNLIGGASANNVAAGVVGATVGGGGALNDANRVNDSFGTIGGGSGNSAGVNDGNANNQSNATIAGGSGNRALAPFAFIGGGRFNEASGLESVIGGGRINKTSGTYNTIPGGQGAAASLYGQFAYASGGFEDNSGIQDIGSAQMTMYVLRSEGTGNRTLRLDGANDQLTIRPDSSMAFIILLVGRSNSNLLSAAYRIDGFVIYNQYANAALLIGPTTITTLGESALSNDLNATISTSGLALEISALNATGLEMRWVATVFATEVVSD